MTQPADPDWADMFKTTPGAVWLLPDETHVFQTADMNRLVAAAVHVALDYTLATTTALMTGDWAPAIAAELRAFEWRTYVTAGAATEADYYREEL